MKPLSIILLALALALSACAPRTPPAPPTQPVSATLGIAPTQAPTAAVKAAPAISMDLNGIAQGFNSQVVAAVPPGPDKPWWEPMPAYTLLDLLGYPVGKHQLAPQIFIYPVSELGVNETAAKAAADLQALLQTLQPGDKVPFLPLYNSSQVMHPALKSLDFQDGRGVRYLTMYSQGVVPVNNNELFYTYQGLTSDGRYYVSAVLPVNLPSLPADENATSALPTDITQYQAYLANTLAMLEAQSPSSFTPDLSKLDAMMQSLQVK